jgi:hypothetical protein
MVKASQLAHAQALFFADDVGLSAQLTKPETKKRDVSRTVHILQGLIDVIQGW